jgi:transcriptional regulator with XRE-family HTH domain
MEIRHWLEQELSERNLSLSAFAREIGVSPGTVSRWIRGHRRPEYDLCQRIAWILDYDPNFVRIQAGHEPYPQARAEQLGLELEQAETRLAVVEAELEHLRQERETLIPKIEKLRAELDRIEIEYEHSSIEEALAAIDALRLPEPIKDELRKVVLDASKEGNHSTATVAGDA